MTAPLARDALVVVVDGEEVPGLIVYGLCERGACRPIEFPHGAWPADPEAGVYALHGDVWEVMLWEIPMIIWPADEAFRAAVQATLRALTNAGCRVAWIGAEGLPFCDPPDLLDPACMSGGVLAWMTDDGAFDCPLDPDRPLTPVDDGYLLSLRSHAEGLADAS